MKYVIYCLVILLTACSDKYSSIMNGAPSTDLSYSRDSLQIREMDPSDILSTGNGKLTIYCKNVNHQLNLVREDTNAIVHLLYRGEDIVPGKALPVADSLQVFIHADKPGLYNLRFYLTDRLGRVSDRQLPVRVKPNRPAIPLFSFRREESLQLHSWPYELDASLSYKEDGIITRYLFSVNGHLIESVSPVVRWIFRAKGEQLVGLSVSDDLGVRSPVVYQKISIQ